MSVNPKLHLYLHTPTPIFKARVNMATVTYPLTSISFDTVTLGAYTDLAEDMTVLLGTGDGLSDLGRTRIKGSPTSVSIPLPRTSKGVQDGLLVVADNMYITVLNDFRPWAKIPFYDVYSTTATTGQDYKDGTVEPGDFNTKLPPVANAGSWVADYVDSGSGLMTVTFPNDGVNLSFVMADGATISSYFWDVDDGTITVGTATSSVITATFPAGKRYVSLTITDSNGKQHTARVFVLSIDADDDPTVENYSLNQNLAKEGQTLEIDLHQSLSRASYPDGTLVLFWWDDMDGDPSTRQHMKFTGWLDTEHYNSQRSKPGIRRSTTLHAADIAGWLSYLPGFPQALYRTEELDSEDNTISPWSYMPSLDMHKAIWYIGMWHSVAFSLADFILPSTLKSYDAMRIDSGASSLFDQMNSLANKVVPDHYLTCNSMGQMEVIRDWRLDDVGDRPIAAPIITEDDYNNLDIDYNHMPKLHVLRSGAVMASTDFVDDGSGNDTVPTVFCIAPGDAAAFGQGLNEQTENEGLALSQSDLNKSEGHRWALLNSYFGNFSFEAISRYLFWDYEPALMNRVQLNIGASYAAFRDLPFTQCTGMVQNLSVSYIASKIGTQIKVRVTFAKDENGYPATTYVPDDTEDVGYTPPSSDIPTTPPSDLFGGQNLVAGVSQYHLYTTSNFTNSTPTWAKKSLASSTSDKILSWVVDPFSAGYVNQDGSGAIDGYYVTHDKIYKIADIFGAQTKSTLLTFATDAAGATHFRRVGASFGRFFETDSDNPWMLCISYYGSTVAHTGTWATYSLDSGATWSSEVQVSAFYDSGLASFQSIGLYMSPKTPGFAYCVAQYETASPARTAFYVTTDWGATWSLVASAEDPAYPLPLFGVFTDTDSSSPVVLDYALVGAVASASHGNSQSASLNQQWQDYLTLAPPANARSITVQGSVVGNRTGGGFGNSGYDFTVGWTGAAVIRTVLSDTNNGLTGKGQTYTRDFVWKFDFSNYATQDWPKNRTLVEAIVGTPVYTDYDIRFGANIIAGGATSSWTADMSIAITVTEIVLDDGTTYTPVTPGLIPIHGAGGSIHIPWPTNPAEDVIFFGSIDRTGNRLYDLKRSVSGTVTTISPTVSAKQYGVHHGDFSIRTHDNDRQQVLLAGVGNESSASESADKTAVFSSADGGDTWSTLLSPVDKTTTLYGLFAAYGADDPDVIYIWGGYNNTAYSILYATDGSTFADKQGNLDSLVDGTYGNIALLGICGGPITA